MFQTKIISIAAFLVLFWCTQLSAQSIGDIQGKYLQFAESISTAPYLNEQNQGQEGVNNIYTRIGWVYFGIDNTAVVRYFLFDAISNKPAWLASDYRHKSASCTSDTNIKIPAYTDFTYLTGEYEVSDNLIKVTISDGECSEDDVVHEWKLKDDQEMLFYKNKPPYGRTSEAHIISGYTYYNNFGFAYLSETYKTGSQISFGDLASSYNGEYYHHNAYQSFSSGWEYETNSFSPYLFTESPGSNARVYYLEYPRDDPTDPRICPVNTPMTAAAE